MFTMSAPSLVHKYLEIQNQLTSIKLDKPETFRGELQMNKFKDHLYQIECLICQINIFPLAWCSCIGILIE